MKCCTVAYPKYEHEQRNLSLSGKNKWHLLKPLHARSPTHELEHSEHENVFKH